jgi:phosphoribosylamine--glycine ligase
MKILIIGSGGREHAILSTLRRTSAETPDLYCAPGNAGIKQIAGCISISATDVAKLAEFASTERIDLTFVGPEAPLALGIVDEFERRGLTIVGPSRAAARLEASKTFAKEFMQRHEIPTASYAVASSANQALEILASEKFGGPENPVVVKADGLAAGKGVVVAENRLAAEEAVRELMTGGLVGSEAAQKIVLEERLQGTESSLLLFSDGQSYALMPAARDHKRIGEGDSGPNTGGMGAITDRSILSDTLISQITEEIVEPTLAGARAEGFPFRGILFIGLMLTADGPKVLEYNVRFGDPETQAILVRLKTDLARIFQSMTAGRLAEIEVDWSPDSSACVVLASAGYPGKYYSGSVITGLNESFPGVEVFHAGTARSESGEWLTSGGRVLGVTALGKTLEQALDRTYQRIGSIHWQGIQFRRDIGKFKGE